MKTKYATTLILGGLFLAVAVGGSGFGGGIANLLMAGFAILSVGYGFKLRSLAKKGIEDTTDEKKSV